MLATVTQWIEDHRRRIATFVAVIFVAVVAIDLSTVVPRATSLDLPLGDDHDAVREVQLAYAQTGGGVVRSVIRRFPEGAPSHLHETIDLPPGDYELTAEVRREGGDTETREASFVAPGEGTIVVSWRD